MKKYRIYFLLPALALLAAGCDPDDDLNDDRSYPLTVHTSMALPAATPAYAPTRAATYTSTTPANGTVLHLFMPNNETSEKKKHDKEYTFTYSTSETKWISSAKVKKDAKYDIFGFMPEAGLDSSTINYTSTVTPFTSGTTTMTLYGIKAANAYDVCFVVGASNGTDEPTTGSYTYTGKDVDNHLYLKLDHLFAEINFQFRINADYGALRKILLKKVTLKTASISTVDVTVRYTPGNAVEFASTDWTTHTATGGSQTQIFPKTDEKPILLTTTLQAIPGYLCPLAVGEDMGYAIEVEYDVYDAHCSDTDIKNGDATPIRAGQKATNKWKNNTSFHVERGTKYTVNCTVNPTYLYQLADADLDSPTFTFE